MNITKTKYATAEDERNICVETARRVNTKELMTNVVDILFGYDHLKELLSSSVKKKINNSMMPNVPIVDTHSSIAWNLFTIHSEELNLWIK